MQCAVSGQYSCGGSAIPGMLQGPQCANRPMGFCTLECSCASQLCRPSMQITGLQLERQASMRSLLPRWRPGPLFCAAGELPQADSGQGRPQVTAAAGATAAALPRLHCWWQPHRRNSSVCACAQQQRQQVIQQRRQAPAAALVPPSEQQQQQQPCTLAAAALPSRFILPPPAPIRACSCNALLSDH